MKKYKITTIVPMYNAEQSLINCLTSLINQTFGFENIQLILIDDGSKDRTKEIALNYVSKYKNIEYYFQKNKGAGSARNFGLTKAKADVISFVDSDDWINEKMYEHLYSVLISEDLDIVSCDYMMVKKNQEIHTTFQNIKNQQLNFMISNVGPCNMIISKKILDKIKGFPEGIIYEDLAMIPALALFTAKIKLISEPYYFYNQANISTMNWVEYNPKLNDIFKAVSVLNDAFKKHDKTRKYNEELEYVLIKNFLIAGSYRYASLGDPEEKTKDIASYFKVNFPNWKKNKYYNKFINKTNHKIVANLVYLNKRKTLIALSWLKQKLYKIKYDWRNE